MQRPARGLAAAPISPDQAEGLAASIVKLMFAHGVRDA